VSLVDKTVAIHIKWNSGFVLLCILCCALDSCKAGPSRQEILESETPRSVFTVTSHPRNTLAPHLPATITTTPKSTPTPIATLVPTPTYPWGDFPGPTEDSEMEIPPPVDPIEFPEGVVNILLLGTDRRPSWKYYQTDAMVILSLDSASGTATFISIPRDLYVYIPGWKVNRINTAEYRGGFDMVADTVLYNLGIPVQHWVRVEYWGFSEAIDILGGIDVRSSGKVDDMCEWVPYKYEPDVVYHMDGFDAMCYIRMRMKSSDFDRLRRQQDVFLALVDKFVSIDGILKIPQLYGTFNQILETDMELGDILPLIPLGTNLALDRSGIRFFRIDYSMIEDWRTPENNYWVLLPKRDLIRHTLQQTLNDR
jgi:LCP family protein required for cell wall assembly